MLYRLFLLLCLTTALFSCHDHDDELPPRSTPPVATAAPTATPTPTATTMPTVTPTATPTPTPTPNIQTYNVTLDGRQVVTSEFTPVNTDRIIEAVVRVNTSTQIISGEIDLSGSEGQPNIRIRQGTVGQNGDEILDFEFDDQNDDGIWEFETSNASQELVELLENGNLYITTHETEIPSSLVRGQILPNEFVTSFFNLSSLQVFRAEDPLRFIPSDGIGYGYFAFNPTTGQLDLAVYSHNLIGSQEPGSTSSTESHIHLGIPGINGGGLVLLNQIPETDHWQVNTTLEDDGEIQLLSLVNREFRNAGLYVNVHTQRFPVEGEIRGQILPENNELFSALLAEPIIILPSSSLEAAAPAPEPEDVRGRGVYAVNTMTGEIHGALSYELEDEVGPSHIHDDNQPNDPAVVTLLNNSENKFLTNEEEGSVIPATSLPSLETEDLFINIHRPDFSVIASGPLVEGLQAPLSPPPGDDEF